MKAVGFVILYDEDNDKRILISKPEETSWTGTFSIPMYEGNSLSDAIHGFYDQYKIILRSNEISRRSSPFNFSFIDEDELVDLDYWIMRVTDLKQLRLNDFIIPQSKLDDKTGWAGFVPWHLVHGRLVRGEKTLYKYIELLTKYDWKIYNKFYSK